MPLAVVCGCGDASGEDLPPGAFTSGPVLDTFDDLGIDGSSVGGGDDDDDTGDVGTETGGADTSDGGSSTGEPCEIPADLSHETHIAPLWANSCTLAATCHVAGAQVPDLETSALATLTDEASPNFGAPYLTAGDSDNSYVYLKLVGRQAEVNGGGGAMPIAPGEMTACEQMIIEAWIDAGAAP